MDIAALYFGLFWGIFPFTALKVMQQTQKILTRSQSLPHHAYLYMIWVELVVNVVFNLASFLYLIGAIDGSRGFLIGITIVWILQTQLLSQIIANRVSLIMVDQRKARFIKLGLVLLVGAVNISVASFWNPGQMPGATPRQVELMKIIERAEKVFFLVLDLGLSLAFLYLVRFRLIALGLSKYWPLFYFNIVAICVSTVMDALFVGMLSLPSPYLYVQFAPVVYIVKLHVELTMAALIVKVAQSSGNSTHASALSAPGNTYPNGSKNCPTLVKDSSLKSGLSTVDSAKLCAVSDWVQMDAGSAAGSEAYLVQTTPDKSIVKTVTTVVKVGAEDELGNARRKTQECGHSWTTLH